VVAFNIEFFKKNIFYFTYLSNQRLKAAALSLPTIISFLITPMSKKTELQFSARRAYTDVLRTITYNNFFDRIFQD
jgi:hypothetical protein